MLFIDITEFRQIQPEKEVDIFQYYNSMQIFLGLRGRSCNIIYSQKSILMSVLQDDPLVLETKENYQNNSNHDGVQQIQQYAQGLRCALAEQLSGLKRYALCGSLIYDSQLYRCRRHLFATGNNSIKTAFCCYMYLPKFSPLASMFVWQFVYLFLFVCNVYDNSRMIWAMITNLGPNIYSFLREILYRVGVDYAIVDLTRLKICQSFEPRQLPRYLNKIVGQKITTLEMLMVILQAYLICDITWVN